MLLAKLAPLPPSFALFFVLLIFHDNLSLFFSLTRSISLYLTPYLDLHTPTPQCFTCSTCRNRLVPGDRFHYINGSLFCEHDRPTALINGHLSSLQTNPLLPDQKVGPLPLPSAMVMTMRWAWGSPRWPPSGFKSDNPRVGSHPRLVISQSSH